LTSSLLARPTDSRTPRLASTPPFFDGSLGGDAVDLADYAGLHLDPWQEDVLKDSLNRRVGGKWAALEVGLVVPRQNGKGAIIEARQLVSLFLTRDAQSIYSAHQFKTSKTMFRRIKQLVRQTPELHKLTGGKYDGTGLPIGGMYRQSNEETGIELLTGERLNFFARSGGSGRGFTGDTMIFDEAYDLDPDMIADLLPTLSAVNNPQVWYVSSAGMDSSEQLAAIRERGIAGNEPRLMYREWSAPDDADSDDEAVLLAANPGIECGRLGLDFIQLVERPGMTEDRFRRERLGIWRPPATVEVAISANDWNAQRDLDSRLHSRMVFAVDMTGDRSTTAISVAGLREDGAYHVEVVEYRPNTDSSWVVPWLVERKAAWNPLGIVIRPGSPAGSLLPDLAAVGIEAMQPGTTAVVQGCGALYDAVMGHKLWHIDQQPLTVAVGRATTKSMAGAWAWDYTSGVDITPLVSVTLALWGYSVKASEVKDVAASVW